jgi:hypothetical protein
MRIVNMASVLGVVIGIGLACLPPAGFAAQPDVGAAESRASAPQRGVVLLVHPQKSTANFLAILDLPVPLSDKGRFAVLDLSAVENVGARYALVYVPQGVEVNPRDLVAVEPGVGDSIGQSGQAAVAIISNAGGKFYAKDFDSDEVSKVVLVPAKNGGPELWIEDQHTGDMQIFAVGRGDVRIQ